jgi:hypothetical protein
MMSEEEPVLPVRRHAKLSHRAGYPGAGRGDFPTLMEDNLGKSASTCAGIL